MNKKIPKTAWAFSWPVIVAILTRKKSQSILGGRLGSIFVEKYAFNSSET